jgi:phytoene dehydrogenase-like protein
VDVVEMIRNVFLTLLIVLLLCGCSSEPKDDTQLSEEDQIRQAVFRYQFEFNASGLGKASNAYYLSVESNHDPSLALLEQFEGHLPQVKPVSASELEAGTAQVTERESGLPGLIFRIEEISWLSNRQVEVEGGYEEASESGSVNIYRLEKTGDHWEVIEVQMLSIK